LDKEVRNALEIAERDLRQCYTKSGIFAGRGHFQEYWARDSFFALLGSNSMGDFAQSKKTLQLFLDLQNENGFLPVKVSRNLKPKYGIFLIGKPVDSNALFIIAMADYARKSGEWLCSKDRDGDGLIEEGFFANWQDTILKHGEVLYSNACYFHALNEFSYLAELLEVKMIASEYAKRAEATKLALNLKFWSNEFYTDWFGLTPHEYFDSAGNILSIAWGVATQHRAEKIEEILAREKLGEVPIRTPHPKYPFWKVIPLLFPLTAYYYHNGFSWPWIGCMNAIALNSIGKKEEAISQLKDVAWQLNEYCVSNEVFDRNNEPVESTMLKSEKPFAWTAGLFIRAVDEIFGIEKPKKEKTPSIEELLKEKLPKEKKKDEDKKTHKEDETEKSKQKNPEK